MDNAGSKTSKLRDACDEAYNRYPKSCSHAVWSLILAFVPNQPYMVANDLIDFLSTSPNWQEVTLAELSVLATQGELIVGGAKADGHGRVIGVYPGDEKPRGGFYVTDKRTGKQVRARETGSYARAMSTTLGSYPGAMSNGDKTVRDPWSEQAFGNVKFWRYIGRRERNANANPQQRLRWGGIASKGSITPKASPKLGSSATKLRWSFETNDLAVGRPEPFIRWVK